MGGFQHCLAPRYSTVKKVDISTTFSFQTNTFELLETRRTRAFELNEANKLSWSNNYRVMQIYLHLRGWCEISRTFIQISIKVVVNNNQLLIYSMIQWKRWINVTLSSYIEFVRFYNRVNTYINRHMYVKFAKFWRTRVGNNQSVLLYSASFTTRVFNLDEIVIRRWLLSEIKNYTSCFPRSFRAIAQARKVPESRLRSRETLSQSVSLIKSWCNNSITSNKAARRPCALIIQLRRETWKRERRGECRRILTNWSGSREKVHAFRDVSREWSRRIRIIFYPGQV